MCSFLLLAIRSNIGNSTWLQHVLQCPDIVTRDVLISSTMTSWYYNLNGQLLRQTTIHLDHVTRAARWLTNS